jgi:hypothetical protein
LIRAGLFFYLAGDRLGGLQRRTWNCGHPAELDAILAEDIYHSNMKLWKVMWVGSSPAPFDNFGQQLGFCGIGENYWDVQNDHVSCITSFNPSEACEIWDKKVSPLNGIM